MDKSVFELYMDKPINMISSRLRLVFVMSKCMRAGWRTIMEATLMENSESEADKSL